jgi:hypothetical protein
MGDRGVDDRAHWSLRRVVVLATVAALHALLVVSLMITLRASFPSSSPQEFLSTFILSPTPSAAQTPNREPPPITNQRGLITPVEPLIVPRPEIDLPATPGTSIDWAAEAERAAAAVTKSPKFRQLGTLPKGRSGGPRRAAPAHQAGEQYRDIEGWVVWVSDRCYIVSGVPPLGMPDVLARSIPTRTVCRDSPKSNTESLESDPMP